ncbi:MAG: sensor histidine kinase [Vulcanimicrobiaceae bacterium]
MSLSVRVSTAIVGTTMVAMIVAAVLVHGAVLGSLDPFAGHFAMMQRMMGWGPEITQIIAGVDRALLVGLVLSFTLAAVAGIVVAAGLTRGVAAIGCGFGRFSRGKLDQPIRVRGPHELSLLANAANRMATDLDAAHRAERELVAGIAHDLAHPLIAMRGTLEAARDGLIDTTDHAITGRLLRSLLAIEETVGDLRDVAAAEVGQIRLQTGQVAVGNLVTEIGEGYRDLASRKGIRLDAEGDTTAVIQTDERRLRRVLENLVVNALQATRPGGKVRLTAAREAGGVVLSTEDESGAGAASRITSALESGSGPGLGLRVVRVIGQALGAAIRVRDGAGGAIIELRLT